MTTTNRTHRDVVAYAESAARRYASRTKDEPEDIAQRILVRVSAEVRSGSAPWGNVVASIRQAIADIARFDRAAKRAHVGWKMVISDGSYTKGGITDLERAELRLDIAACLDHEGESVRRLCSLLETMSLSEAAEVMNVPRSTLRGWLASLRERLEARGLGRD